MNENAKTSAEMAAGEIKVTQNTEKTGKKYDKTDFIFAVIYAVLGWCYVKFFFMYDWYGNFDFLFPLYSVAYIAVVLSYAKCKNVQIPRESFFWIGVMLCVAFTFKMDRFFLLVIQSCVAAYFTAVTGGLYGGGSSAYLAADLWNTFAMKPVVNFSAAVGAVIHAIKTKAVKREKKGLSPAVIGGVMAAVALTVIVPLLIEADSNFLSGTTDFVNHLLEGLFGDGFINTLVTLFLAFPVTCYLYGLGYGSLSADELFTRDDMDRTRDTARVAVAVTIKFFLYGVSAVYVLFILLQAEYLLGAFTGNLYPGMTYAQYARTGFFELCKVAAINLTILIIAHLIVRKEDENQIKAPVTVLCVLSLLLLSTAMAKMVMYICAYGLTEKRIISTVFLLWLAVVFVMCIIRLHRSFNLTKSALLTGAVMFCVLFSFDIAVHSENFNTKYGYDMKAQVETYIQTEIRMPDKINIVSVGIRHSTDDGYGYTLNNTIYNLDKLYDITENAVLTDIPSIQDFPSVDDYYTITIDSGMYYTEPETTLYCYSISGHIYLEQPYGGVWEIQENLPAQFEEYSF
ncbi:MAG: DUF4173 domain-containing protein [Oscillospiraceae bacterium]|nr:DUF4173 domain-containing protein [Oscillospiraceae bacterium]